MQQLKQLATTSTSCIVTWSQVDECNTYMIEGMTSLFFYTPITTISNENNYILDKKLAKEYIFIRISYYRDEETDIVIDYSNPLKLEWPDANIVCNAMKSYEGVSISFDSPIIFDKYVLRCLSTERPWHIETKDFIVTGPQLIQGEKYIVEGYVYRNDDYVLEGCSEEYICDFTDMTITATPIVSVVIPIYNCGKFVPRTIDSVLLSTLKDIEVILVDDGSTDNSAMVCDWYEQTYPNVKVIHQENMRVAAARNAGMAIARGEFIAFVDSDDIVCPKMYESLYQATLDNNTDIAIARVLIRQDFDKDIWHIHGELKDKYFVVNSYEGMLDVYGTKDTVYFVSSCNKIIKREVANKVSFDPTLLTYEDVAYTGAVYTFLDKFVVARDAVYVWDQRKRKTVGTLSTQKKGTQELMWRSCVLAYLSGLMYGNTENRKVMEMFGQHNVTEMLIDYAKTNTSSNKNVILGMLKYIIRYYNIPMEPMANGRREAYRKAYQMWEKVKNTDIPEYDGNGPIPDSYFA